MAIFSINNGCAQQNILEHEATYSLKSFKGIVYKINFI